MEYEVIDLASEGWFYNKNHPFSSGKARIKPFCFNIEKILCNQNLKKRGEIDKEFIKNIVVEDVEFNSILNCDYETIILNSRILNYGKTGKYKVTCPHCEAESQQDISFLFKGKPTPNPIIYGENGMKVGLLSGDEHLILKLPTVSEHRKFSDVNWLDFLKIITVSYSGGDANSFIDNGLSVKDSRYLRSLYKDNFPGFTTISELSCSCGESFNISVDPNIDIFGFSPEYRKNIQEEMFDLCYHSEGTFQMEYVQSMNVLDRAFYINRLVETINKRQEAENKAANSAKNGGAKPVSAPPKVK